MASSFQPPSRRTDQPLAISRRLGIWERRPLDAQADRLRGGTELGGIDAISVVDQRPMLLLAGDELSVIRPSFCPSGTESLHQIWTMSPQLVQNHGRVRTDESLREDIAGKR
jgi:hypothetical protein